MQKEFIVYQSKFKQILMIILTVLMIIACLYLLFIDLSSQKMYVRRISPGFAKLVAIVGIIFFTYILFLRVKKLPYGDQLIILKQAGIVLDPSKKQLLSWGNITKMEIVTAEKQSFISIYLNNSERFLAEMPPLERFMAKANVLMGTGLVNISLNTAKGIGYDELLEKMQAYFFAYQKENNLIKEP